MAKIMVVEDDQTMVTLLKTLLKMDGFDVIALDENGKQMTSRGLATELGRVRDAAVTGTAFVIGGPDGLDPAFLASVSLTLGFGTMTWPHQLARIMAAEQIYRAMTILSGHPYHRE